MANIDFVQLYAPSAVKAWRLPFGSSSDPANGLVQGLRLVWSQLPEGPGGTDSAPLRFVCCDVLVLDREAPIDRPTFVFARRIELGPKAAFVLDRTRRSDIDLTLFAQAVVDATTGNKRDLPVTAVFEKGGVPSQAPDYNFQGDAGGRASGMVWAPGAEAAKPMAAKDIDRGHLLVGEPLWLALTTTFQVATLLSVQAPELSIAQLRWVAALAQASPSSRELADQAGATAADLEAARAVGSNAVLVPRLDASIWALEAQAMLKVLSERDQKWEALLERIHNDKNWAADAAVALAQTVNQDDLSQKLENQARSTREQAMRALSVAIGQMVNARLQMRFRELDFADGIEKWKRQETLAEAVNIVFGVVKILMQIPAIVAAGPQLGVLPAVETAKGVAEFLFTGSKAVLNEIVSRAKSNPGKPDPGKPDPGKSDPGPDIGISDKDFLDLFGEPDDDVGVSHEDFMALFGEPDDVGVSYDDFVALFGNLGARPGVFRRPEKPRAEPKPDDPPPAPDAAVLKKRQQAQDNLVNALKEAGAAGKEIFDSASRILSIASTAASLHQNSEAIWKSADSAIGTSFESAELQGLDVVTGGEQAWDKLGVDIEDVFDNFKEGLLKGIDGGTEYRREFRRLLVCGRSLSQARLAVARANTQLAELTLRRKAAKRAVEIASTRAKNLGRQIADAETLARLLFSTVVDAKRSVYLSLEAYGRAYRYFTLSDPSRVPAAPPITASFSEFNKAVQTISGNALIKGALSPTPQTIEQIKLSLNDPELLAEIKSTGYGSWTLDLSHQAFNGFFRIRTDQVRVFAEGLATPDVIDVQIKTSGVYHDKYPPHARRENLVRFVSEPTHLRFRYNNGSMRMVSFDGKAPRRYENDFFVPTPFTLWMIKITRADGGPLDLGGVTGLTVELHGEASPA